VLVVDDEPSVCAVLVPVLSNLGCDPVATSDPRVALRMMEELNTPLDILVTDFAMPHLSGLELISRAKALRPTLKAILASGEVDQPAVPQEVGPDVYLEKPFSTRALAAALDSLVGGRKSERLDDGRGGGPWIRSGIDGPANHEP
jgi:CheY-like chemotaxis protein